MQKTTKDRKQMKNSKNKLDLTDIYKTLYLTEVECILLKCIWNTDKTDHILDQKTSFNTFKGFKSHKVCF